MPPSRWNTSIGQSVLLIPVGSAIVVGNFLVLHSIPLSFLLLGSLSSVNLLPEKPHLRLHLQGMVQKVT
jgi:hypothetical protein